MARKVTILVLGALLLSGAAASAQTIAGTYAFLLTVNCQGMLRLHKDGSGKMFNVTMQRPGMLQEVLGTATFGTATGKAHIVGHMVSGDLLRILGQAGEAMRQQSLNVWWTYSNTASTFTLNGKLYRAVYTNVASGVAGGAYFQRLTDNCVESGSAIRK
jgi:hypothetical protein